MSRWAEAFAALSGAPDTSDTTDTRSVDGARAKASVASVNSVGPKGRAETAPAGGPENQAKRSAGRPSVNCVNCVNCVTPQNKGAPMRPESPAPSIPDRSATLATKGADSEERAAIVEHDGGATRTSWAEDFARLDPERPPAEVPPHRWQRFVDDVGLFLDGGFAEQAAALGWGPHDLFGCDGDRPLARIDRAGLLWLLKGDKLVALTADTATIEARTGTRLTYRRKPDGEPGRVLAWELSRD
jgi:hypothetical protein